MMMTSGEKVHYKSSLDCAKQIVAKEGMRSLFKVCVRGLSWPRLCGGGDGVGGLAEALQSPAHTSPCSLNSSLSAHQNSCALVMTRALS